MECLPYHRKIMQIKSFHTEKVWKNFSFPIFVQIVEFRPHFQQQQKNISSFSMVQLVCVVLPHLNTLVDL